MAWKKQWPGLSWEWPLASKDSRLCGLTQGGGSEERSGLLFQTAFFAALSLRASASRFLPPVLQSTSSYAKDIHGYCSSSLAMSRYPTNHASKAFWKPSEAKFHKKPWQVEQRSVINVVSINIISIQALSWDGIELLIAHSKRLVFRNWKCELIEYPSLKLSASFRDEICSNMGFHFRPQMDKPLSQLIYFYSDDFYSMIWYIAIWLS